MNEVLVYGEQTDPGVLWDASDVDSLLPVDDERVRAPLSLLHRPKAELRLHDRKRVFRVGLRERGSVHEGREGCVVQRPLSIVHPQLAPPSVPAQG